MPGHPFVSVTPPTENGSVVQEVAGVALALYRKYRPRTFAEVIGQEHVTEPLSQAFAAAGCTMPTCSPGRAAAERRRARASSPAR